MLSLGSNISSTQAVESKYSASFDGTDDFINFSNVHNLGTGDFSFSFWVKASDTTTNFLFSKREDNDNRWYIRTEGNDAIQFFVKKSASSIMSATSSLSGTISANVWNHVVITCDRSDGSTGLKFYINGSLENSAAASTTDVDNTGDFHIGRFNTDYAKNGTFLEEIGIFNVALDADAVTAIYNGGSPLNLKFDQGNYDNSSALQAYYKMGNGLFDDKANGIVHDQDNPGFGNNLVVNADFSANQAESQTYLNGGLQFDNWVEQQSSGLRKFELTSDGQGIRCTIETANDLTWNQRIYQDVSSVLTVGDVYEFSVDVLCSLARNFEACIETVGGANDQFSPDDVALSANTRTVIKKVFRCTTTTGMVFHLYPLGDPLPAGEFYEVRNPSLKKLNGKPGLTSGGVTFSSDTP